MEPSVSAHGEGAHAVDVEREAHPVREVVGHLRQLTHGAVHLWHVRRILPEDEREPGEVEDHRQEPVGEVFVPVAAPL